MKKLVVLLLLLFTNLFLFGQNKVYDSLLFNNEKIALNKSIDLKQFNINNKLNELTLKSRSNLHIDKGYSSIFSCLNDSLFLIDLNIISTQINEVDKMKSKLFTLDSKLFLNYFSDTISIYKGQKIRSVKFKIDKNIYQKEEVLIFKEGILVKNETYDNLICNKDYLSRATESSIEIELLKLIKNAIDWKIVKSLYKKDNISILNFELVYGGNGRIEKIKPLINNNFDTYNYFIKLIESFKIYDWDIRLKYGVTVNEMFTLKIDVIRKNKINIKIKYIKEFSN